MLLKNKPSDSGGKPLIINIDRAAAVNTDYRRAVWTGEFLQLTLMSIPVGGEIGAEIHEDTDQLIRIEQGFAMVQMGSGNDKMENIQRINNNFAFVIPAGVWHNIVNCGNVPLKLYSVYAPPNHPFGTVEQKSPN